MGLSSSDIRSLFIGYFREHGHTPVPSSSLVPADDPTLLFANAGMNQFKEYFTGRTRPAFRRATTVQKCVRAGGKHNDLENVGRTARHHTFFEMLGNFSFGDYFKREAISFAWELVTARFGLPRERLWATVFRDDDEAAAIWAEVAGLPVERIVRMGEKDNFWAMGDTGPCGPCSEILVDQGERMSCGPDCGIGRCDCDRYLEIWNLVFMQYERAADGSLSPLPAPSIDTGAGLERITALCQGVASNYESDLFLPLIEFAGQLRGLRYGADPESDVSLRVIADHARATTFLVGDGVLPSNEGRGYVLRRIMRRAIRHGHRLGLPDPFLHRVAGRVIDSLGPFYPELERNREFILKVAGEEERRFRTTLDRGIRLLAEEIDTVDRAGGRTVPGGVAFRLYDTYGFPPDLTAVIAGERGLSVDIDGFEREMEAQRRRGEQSWKGDAGVGEAASVFGPIAERHGPTESTMYTPDPLETTLLALVGAGGPVETLGPGEEGEAITATSPFYPESGGQVGDTGEISSPLGRAEVLDTYRRAGSLVVHRIRVVEGSIESGGPVRLAIDQGRRVPTQNNHTATHLLQRALRQVLGGHVKQAGSLVTPERLRFDYSHFSPLSRDEQFAVEREVNALIAADLPVGWETMSQQAALERGAIALFGEKYGETVRMVTVGDGVSRELCGGTHTDRTGTLGCFVIVSDEAVASGVRRIEALTGEAAVDWLHGVRGQALDAAHALGVGVPGLAAAVEKIQAQLKEVRREKERLDERINAEQSKSVVYEPVADDSPVRFAFRDFGVVENPQKLRSFAQEATARAKDQHGQQTGLVTFATGSIGGKLNVVVASAGEAPGADAIVKTLTALHGGRGGGNRQTAQAGLAAAVFSAAEAVAALLEAMRR